MTKLGIAILLTSLISCNESASENKSSEEKKPDTTITKKKYKPEQPIKFDHAIQNSGIQDCSFCHTKYTEKDTVLLKGKQE